MDLREVSQAAALGFNALLALVAFLGILARPSMKWSLLLWVVYGLAGTAFYFIVIVLEQQRLGNDISSYRSLFQNTLVFVAVLLRVWPDVREWVSWMISSRFSSRQ